ncbi:hypothetical protein VTK26DRAFT_3562 [Humicola hyalothermophila]
MSEPGKGPHITPKSITTSNIVLPRPRPFFPTPAYDHHRPTPGRPLIPASSHQHHQMSIGKGYLKTRRI